MGVGKTLATSSPISIRLHHKICKVRSEPEVRMEVTREFKPEAMRSDEIVEILYRLLSDGESLPQDVTPMPALIATPPPSADLLSRPHRVTNVHGQ